MKTKLALILFTCCFLVFLTQPASATIILGVEPSSQTVGVGDAFSVGLVISGLDSFAAPSLSTFDLDISYDPIILAFSSVSFGDPILGDQLDLVGLGRYTDFSDSNGTINMYELSFDSVDDLNDLQPDSFILATVSFDALFAGNTALTLRINAFGDAMGDPLGEITLGGGSVTVTGAAPVPEPATILLLAAGMGGLGLVRRRRLMS
jgi:hypothetical protein